MDLYETEKHSRTYHFTNGESLVISNIERIRLDEDMIELCHRGIRTVIYRNNLNYFITSDPDA